MASKGIQVVIRFRPLNETEKQQGPDACVDIRSDKEIAVVDRDGIPATKGGGALNLALDQQKNFTFDHVFRSAAKQEELFEAVGRPVVANVLKGYHGTILAYGQTGSGKTHSMIGPEGGTVDVLSANATHFALRGIIPRLVQALFDQLQAKPQEEVSWKVATSVFELYKENVQDLLTEGPQQDYRIREDNVGGRGVYVENLFAKPCLSATELLEAIRVGVSRRKVAATKANDNSSRSHSITVITVEQVNHVQGGTITRSRLNLVDLAGSEKVAKTQADGERLKEANMINLSLTHLGNVINALTDGKSAYVPYRNSKLTRILQDSLGGNSMTTLLCHCSPAMYNGEETLGTLRFAARAKQIKNDPKVNRELSQKELQLQLAQALDRIKFLEEIVKVQTITTSESLGRSSGLNGSLHKDPSPVRSARFGSGGNKAENEASTEGATAADNDALLGENNDLKRLVDSLLAQLEDVKNDLRSKEEELAERSQLVEFHRDRATAAENELQEHMARWKRDEGLLQRRLLDLEASNLTLSLQHEKLVDTPVFVAPSAVSSNGLASASKRSHQPPVVGPRTVTLRNKTFDARGQVESGDQRRTSLAGLEVAGFAATRTSTSPVAGGAGSGVVDAKQETPRDVGVSDKGSAPGSSKPRRSAGSKGAPDASGTPVDGPVEGGEVSTPCVAMTPMETLAPPSDGSLLMERTKKPPVEMVDVAITALVGKSEAELQKEIDDISAHTRMLMAKSQTVSKNLADAQDQLGKLSDMLEVARAERDDARQELDALRKLLESKEKENEFMKRVLDELNINLADFQHLLLDEKNRATQLAEEAAGLRNHNDALRKTAEQQEFVEMASMELLIKAEDMEAVEQDLMRMPTLPTEELFLKKRDFCLQILRQLSMFLDSIASQLSRQQFNTGNLESRRLQLLSEASALTSRCDDARTLLKG